jgi:hypothetical protein
LVGKITPTTPPKVRLEREQHETEQADKIVLEFKELAWIYDSTAGIWMIMA